MKYVNSFFFFLFSFLISSTIVYLLKRANFIEEFKTNNLKSFIEYIFIGLFMIHSFPLIEVIFSKKHKGHVIEMLRNKDFYLCSRFSGLKIKRQFFVGSLSDNSLRIVGKIIGNKRIGIGDHFLYYYQKYYTKGNKVRLFEKRDIFFQIMKLLVMLVASQIVRIWGNVINGNG